MKVRAWNYLLLLGVMLSGICTNTWAIVNCTSQDLNAVAVTKNVDFPTQIQPIFTQNCVGCHGGAASLFLTADVVFANLINVPAQNQNAGIPRVTPRNEESSFLFKKINCTDLNTMVHGNRMPLGGILSASSQALILDWIQQGAKAQRMNPTDYIFYSGFSRN